MFSKLKFLKLFIYYLKLYFISALLISGLLAKDIQYSPYSIKRAIENTAMFVDTLDQFAQGSGLLQVEKAFENLILSSNSQERDVKFTVSCGANNAKGILIRSGIIDRSKDYAITVEPIFMDHENIGNKNLIFYNNNIIK